MPGTVLGIVDAAVRHTLFMELAFLWDMKDKQIHGCDDCHKENLRQAKEAESDGRRGVGAVLDNLFREGILWCHLSRDLK